MAYYLVQFVEDDLYQVCPKSSVRHNVEEPGLVSAKYKGIYFRAVIISEGEDQDVDEPSVGPSSSLSTPKKKFKIIIRKSWTTPEKAVMRKHFKRHFDSDTLPTPMECYDAKNRYTPLKCRTVAQIKAFVFNENRRKKRKRN